MSGLGGTMGARDHMSNRNEYPQFPMQQPMNQNMNMNMVNMFMDVPNLQTVEEI